MLQRDMVRVRGRVRSLNLIHWFQINWFLELTGLSYRVDRGGLEIGKGVMSYGLDTGHFD